MSEYLNKKAALEWLKEQQKRQEEKRDRLEIDHPYWEYHEGASDYLSLAVEKFESGAFDVDQTEIQRLRAALHKITQIFDDPNLHDLTACQEMNRVAKEALSAATESTGQKDADDLIGDRIDEKCPKCGADMLANKVGDKWCSLVGCDYSINAPEGAES